MRTARAAWVALMLPIAAAATPVTSPNFPGVLCETIQVPMRDGTLLATDMYTPTAAGKYPVILLRNPYVRAIGSGCFNGLGANIAGFAQHGYVALAQEVRGTYRSQGAFREMVHETRNGYDAIEWAAAQPWSTGKVGTTSGSYLGLTQWQPGIHAPPHLVAISPQITASDYLQVVGAFRNFAGMRSEGGTDAARRGTKILVGPYRHAGVYENDPNVTLHVLVPPDTGTTGSGFLVYGDSYPLNGTNWENLFLVSGGNANVSKGDGQLLWQAKNSPPDRFDYDPANPVPTTGGNMCCNAVLLADGTQDQTQVELPQDVLVYTSAPLAQDTAVIEPVEVTLWAIRDLLKLGEGTPPKLGMPTAEVVGAFHSFLGFPRVTSDAVIRAAIAKGVETGVFAYTTGNPKLGEDGRFQVDPSKVRLNQSVSVDEIDLDGGFLMMPAAVPAPVVGPGPVVGPPPAPRGPVGPTPLGPVGPGPGTTNP